MQAPRLSRGLVLSLLPLVFFGTLLALHARQPDVLVFDEIHYVPAAKALIAFEDNVNAEHPPLAKLIMGAGWWIFAKTLHWAGEPAVFREVSAVFGLLALWAVRAWMIELGFSSAAAAAAVWLTGFDFLWFVQSKTAMLDIYAVAFGLWGALLAWPKRHAAPRFWMGWSLLGCAVACKWSAAPYLVVALALGGGSPLLRAAGLLAAIATYAVAELPLAFLAKNAVPAFSSLPHAHETIGKLAAIGGADHPYRSSWWQWVLMIRPMWYFFDQGPAGDRNVWAACNPLLAWTSAPLALIALAKAFARPPRSTARAAPADRSAHRAVQALAALYWLPLLFWIFAPRATQLYYYYLPSSMMLGPLIVWAHERLARGRPSQPVRAEVRHARGWLLIGFVLLCAAIFLYFLPMMDARLVPTDEFRRYMWFSSWL